MGNPILDVGVCTEGWRVGVSNREHNLIFSSRADQIPLPLGFDLCFMDSCVDDQQPYGISMLVVGEEFCFLAVLRNGVP